jgi:hypothetical protein
MKHLFPGLHSVSARFCSAFVTTRSRNEVSTPSVSHLSLLVILKNLQANYTTILNQMPLVVPLFCGLINDNIVGSWFLTSMDPSKQHGHPVYAVLMEYLPR